MELPEKIKEARKWLTEKKVSHFSYGFGKNIKKYL